MYPRPPGSTRPDTLFPYPPLSPSTLAGSWTRRSQDNRTDRCESAFTHSSSFPARWRPTLPVKDRQPVFGIVADLGADGIEQRHRFRGARENCQLVGETAKIELDDD